jgi:HEAT repeat protein
VRGRVSDFHEALRSKCHSSKAVDRLRAVNMARCYELESQLATDMLRLARDPDRVVRSAALGALGGVPGPLNRRLLLEAVQDRDARVRANAVEALDRLGFDRELVALETRVGDANNRVQANLARAFVRLRPDRALELLDGMLASPDRSRRISALWVARDCGLAAGGKLADGLRDRLARMSDGDPDPRIRRRADAALVGHEPVEKTAGNWFLEELLR